MRNVFFKCRVRKLFRTSFISDIFINILRCVSLTYIEQNGGLIFLANTKHITTEHSAPRHVDAAAAWKVGCLMLSVLLIISVLTQGFGFGSGNAAPQQIVPQNPTGGQQQPIVKADLKEDGDPAMGDKSAPVTIFEFSDYQCPFCKRAFDETYPEMKKLAEEGKIRLIFKDYPLPFHEQADEAAVAASCAGQQDKYWQMHDKLFQTQTTWSGNTDPYTVFKGYAKELGLNAGKFDKCIVDPAVAKEVQDDANEGSAAGVSGTPTFYVNGIQLVGAQPWTAFKQIIDQELSK